MAKQLVVRYEKSIILKGYAFVWCNPAFGEAAIKIKKNSEQNNFYAEKTLQDYYLDNKEMYRKLNPFRLSVLCLILNFSFWYSDSEAITDPAVAMQSLWRQLDL